MAFFCILKTVDFVDSVDFTMWLLAINYFVFSTSFNLGKKQTCECIRLVNVIIAF